MNICKIKNIFYKITLIDQNDRLELHMAKNLAPNDIKFDIELELDILIGHLSKK